MQIVRETRFPACFRPFMLTKRAYTGCQGPYASGKPCFMPFFFCIKIPRFRNEGLRTPTSHSFMCRVTPYALENNGNQSRVVYFFRLFDAELKRRQNTGKPHKIPLTFHAPCLYNVGKSGRQNQSRIVYNSGLVSIIFHFFTNRKPKMKK